MQSLFPSFYFPSVFYLRKLTLANHIAFDKAEHFIKQTYRNRCYILGAEKIEALIVPVVKTQGNHTPMGLALPDYSVLWQHKHISSIKTCYGSAPYFVYYIDKIEQLIGVKYNSIFELNMATVSFLLSAFRQNIQYNIIEEYISSEENKNISDYRNAFIAKPLPIANPDFKPTYNQVFGNSFVPNLSSLDLLMNNGPDGWRYIQMLGNL